MPGVKIAHPELRNQTLVFEDPDWPYPGGPFLCSTCEAAHVNKAVHLRFDALGHCVVAEESWEKIKPHLAGVVTEVGLEQEPEPLVLDLNDNGQREVFQVVRMES